MKLKEYKNKRDFTKTQEPKPILQHKTEKVLRFVVQFHQARRDHYDFRLEYDGVLLSWAVPKEPSYNPKERRLAIKVEDHPLDYINFEGQIPKGNYGAGSVEIWDKGFYLPVTNIKKGLKDKNLKFVLNGKKLKGVWNLVNIKDNNWLLIKGEDDFSNDIKKEKLIKNPFKSLDVQLALLAKSIPSGNDWLYEIKYDGYRIVAYLENSKVKLVSRNGKDYTKKFDNVVQSLSKIAKNKSMVLDGEIVCFDDNGKSDFGLLQRNIKAKENNFVYVVFDILAFNGKDLRDEKILERKDILNKSLVKTPSSIIISEYVIGKGKESFNVAKKLGLEGIVGKKIDSIYSGTRNGDWIKIKCYLRQEFVLVGYTTTEKNTKLSALILGYYKKTQLIYVGKVGTGFTDEQRSELNNKFNKIKSKKCHFDEMPKELKNENITWLEPKIVVEIQFAELTSDKQIRQGSFIGIRKDKIASDVVLEGDKNE